MKPGELLYLASPYSSPDPVFREFRFREACRVSARLMSEGYAVFSPIAHSHPIAEFLAPGLTCDHDFWMREDLPILSRCDRIVVLRLSGWEKSRGIAAEIASAASLDIPLEYIDP